MARNTGPTQLVRNAVIFRDNFSCRRCGKTPASQIHHRAPRGRGGTKCEWINGKANLALLDLECHEFIERNRTYGYETGWLIKRNSNDLPEEVPLTDIYGRQFFLDDLGGVTYITKEAS